MTDRDTFAAAALTGLLAGLPIKQIVHAVFYAATRKVVSLGGWKSQRKQTT